MADDKGTDRRGALKALAVLGSAVCGGTLALPSARFLVGPAEGGAGTGRWIPTVRLDSLRDGELRRVALVADHRDGWTLEKDVQLGSAWLLREGDAVKAWSTTCPHLGCAIDRAAAGQPGFNCPCHDSGFDPQGRRLSGPSPRDMDALEARVEGGVVEVEYRRFRQGIPEKEPIG